MSEPSELRIEQRPTDWTNLYGGRDNQCRPLDVDLWTAALPGRTHRGIGKKDYFLTMEVKRGDGMKNSQKRALEAEARRENSVVLVVWSHRRLTEKKAWDFLPFAFAVIMPTGFWEAQDTNLEDFRRRYNEWCNAPSLGTKVWTDGPQDCTIPGPIRAAATL